MINSEAIALLQRTALTPEDRNLLGQSTYYFCCGKDPTPIAAFDDACPLYIYVDMMYFDDYHASKDWIYDRLVSLGFTLRELAPGPDSPRLRKAQKCELSSWTGKSGKEFVVMYIQGEAEEMFRTIYADYEQNGSINYIMPECICNYKYETIGNHFDWLFSLSKRTSYIMGYCDTRYHTLVDTVPYWGPDGGPKPCINLYQRLWYYAF